ncbi:MAG: hypothetical protein EBT57_10110 [Verrucomicrobia bacterium]|nr:hypothetical protein [Verrucomicrobiota bacterium]
MENLKFCLCCLVCAPVSMAAWIGVTLFIYTFIPFLFGCVLKPIGFFIRNLPYGHEFLVALPWILSSILLIFLCGVWGCLLGGLLSPEKALTKSGIPEEKAKKISNRVETVCFFIPGSIVAFFLLKHFLAHS